MVETVDRRAMKHGYQVLTGPRGLCSFELHAGSATDTQSAVLLYIMCDYNGL